MSPSQLKPTILGRNTDAKAESYAYNSAKILVLYVIGVRGRTRYVLEYIVQSNTVVLEYCIVLRTMYCSTVYYYDPNITQHIYA